MQNLVEIKNLSIGFQSQLSKKNVVNSISFNIPKGQTVALVGESGSGKSVTAMSIVKLLPYPNAYHNSGEIIYNNIDLLKANKSTIQKIRGKNISAIFQEPMTSLNPLHTIQKQINEILTTHSSISLQDANRKTSELLKLVGLENISQRIKSYPHELSGGQRQRVMIAMSIANNPDLLIADEPTTALDVSVQAQILELIQNIQRKLNMSILFISHDLNVVKKIADYVCIMKDGKIIEQNTKNNIFDNPQEFYTKMLTTSKLNKKDTNIKKRDKILKVEKLKVWYPIKKGILRRTIGHVKAIDEVSFELESKKTIGILGESGSGKTSLVLAILKLISANGKITFKDINLSQINKTALKKLRKEIQIVFQDPFSSLSPRMTIEEIVSEGLVIHEKNLHKDQKKIKIQKILEEVGLNYDENFSKFPHEFSGGQRQRIAIARALILKPQLLILDEPTSALDVNTQNQILDLLNKLQDKYDLSYIFISHDLNVIKAISNYVIVLKDGKIIEEGNVDNIFNSPSNIYTKNLVNAVM